MRSFVRIQSSRIGYITLSFIDIGESRPFKVANMCFNAIRENKIHAKISEFTVFVVGVYMYMKYFESQLGRIILKSETLMLQLNSSSNFGISHSFLGGGGIFSHKYE